VEDLAAGAVVLHGDSVLCGEGVSGASLCTRPKEAGRAMLEVDVQLIGDGDGEALLTSGVRVLGPALLPWIVGLVWLASG